MLASYHDESLKDPLGKKYVTAQFMFTDNVKTVTVCSKLRTTGGNDKVNYWEQYTIGEVPSNTKNVLFYNEDGSLVTEALAKNVWYKVVLPLAESTASGNGAWGTFYVEFGANDSAVATEIYFKDYAYGDTIPAGWINE